MTARRGLSLPAKLAVALISWACSPTYTPVGPGGECFVATDCAAGLVCLEQPNKTRICSDDLTGVAGRARPDGSAPDGAASAQEASTDAVEDAQGDASAE